MAFESNYQWLRQLGHHSQFKSEALPKVQIMMELPIKYIFPSIPKIKTTNQRKKYNWKRKWMIVVYFDQLRGDAHTQKLKMNKKTFFIFWILFKAGWHANTGQHPEGVPRIHLFWLILYLLMSPQAPAASGENEKG